MDSLADLVVIALIAAVAQTVNQSMGMGYGVISSSLLLTSGMPPAAISATVHLAEVGTSATGGAAHWRLGHVDRRTMLGLAVPGAVGGFAGALLLTAIPASTARPFVAAILLTLGALILIRSVRRLSPRAPAPWRTRALAPLGATAGALDATGGGGWGPVTMGTLMQRPPGPPRVVVGTVNASEAVVTVAITLGFLAGSGVAGFHLVEAAALMAGGMVVSAPAALLARRVPTRAFGVAVGLLLVALNARVLAVAAGLGPLAVSAVVAGLMAGLLLILIATRRAPTASGSVSLRAGIPAAVGVETEAPSERAS